MLIIVFYCRNHFPSFLSDSKLLCFVFHFTPDLCTQKLPWLLFEGQAEVNLNLMRKCGCGNCAALICVTDKLASWITLWQGANGSPTAVSHAALLSWTDSYHLEWQTLLLFQFLLWRFEAVSNALRVPFRIHLHHTDLSCAECNKRIIINVN